MTDPLPHEQRRARRPQTNHKLRRSNTERLLGGVASGIAAYTGSNPLWVRSLFAAGIFFTGGLVVIAYVLLWWLIPPESA